MIGIKVARIEEVRKHPNADKLYIEKIDLGGEKRQIVSGLAGHYEPEELQGKNILVVYNLKPANLRGERSEGMLLAVSKEDEIAIVEAPDLKPGDKIKFEEDVNDEGEITIQEFFNHKLEVKNGKLYIDGNSSTKNLKTDKGIEGKVE